MADDPAEGSRFMFWVGRPPAERAGPPEAGVDAEDASSQETMSSPTSSQEEFLDGIEFGPEVLEAREEFIAHRLREFDVLVSNISTCEVINVLGVNKDKLEEIRDLLHQL